MMKAKKNKTALTLAREALKDNSQAASHQRQWRAYVREIHLARVVVADDKAKRKLRAEIRDLRLALAKACDLAIDAADVIDSIDVVDPDDGESEDFRGQIAKLRELTGAPKAERHVERGAIATEHDDVETVDERPKQPDESDPLYQQYRDACDEKDRA